jgi:integrase/recombinase XerD
MVKRPDDSPWLFCTNRGEQMPKLRMHRIVAGIGKRIGIKAYPHRLRHTFATWYTKEGGDPYSLQYRIGHEDMTVTRMYVKMAARDVTGTYRSLLDGM